MKVACQVMNAALYVFECIRVNRLPQFI